MDLEGLRALRDCINNPTVTLANVDLMYNRIGNFKNYKDIVSIILFFYALGEPGAKVLLEAITPENSKIKEFLVDLTLPMPIFEQLFRKAGGKKGAKGKKGGKKKK